MNTLDFSINNLATSIRETEGRITVGDLPVVHMREKHLAQLFQNLIGNAVKYGRVPASRAELFKKIRGLETGICPFANLPEAKSGRWGVGLTLAKMKECRWVYPTPVGQFEFLEWTSDRHLRHSKFIALCDHKFSLSVRREPTRES